MRQGYVALLGLSLSTVLLAADPAPSAAPVPAAAPAPAAATAPVDESTKKLVDCMKANIPPTVRIQTIEVIATDRAGSERTLKGTVYATREAGKASVMLRVDAPADLARSAYLVRESASGDEIYVYLPAVNRTRRVTGAAVDGNLWGSDISYNDLKMLQSAFDGATLQRDPAVAVDGFPTEVVSFMPRAGSGGKYTQVRAYLDPKSCLAVKAEFMEGAEVRKLLTVAPKDFKQSGPRWYPAEALVQTPSAGTRTRIKVTGFSAGDKLSSRFFNPTSFYQ